jgi:hypothetical protein
LSSTFRAASKFPFSVIDGAQSTYEVVTRQLLDAYEAALRDNARAEGEQASGNDGAAISNWRPRRRGELFGTLFLRRHSTAARITVALASELDDDAELEDLARRKPEVGGGVSRVP